MGEIIELTQKDKFEVEYIFDDDDRVIAVTHPKWPFRVMRNGSQIALVCEETNEPFGELDGDVFNTLLICWLLIDDPNLIDQAAIKDEAPIDN